MSPAVLITGGGTGIGAAVARRMAQSGFEVCVSGRRPEPIEEVAESIGGCAISADVRDPDGVSRLVHGCFDHFGRLDAVIFSSGTGASGTAGQQTLERWNMVIETNLTGAFLVCRAALPYLIDSGGAIVTVASVAGLLADPASAAYCSSKAGLVMLTKSIALDYGPEGVRANCVCPGWIRTPMADTAMDGLASRAATEREGAYRLAAAQVPARRPGSVEEAAEAIAWLASPAASYVNGAVLTVDGGAAIVDVGTLAFANDGRPIPADETRGD